MRARRARECSTEAALRSIKKDNNRCKRCMCFCVIMPVEYALAIVALTICPMSAVCWTVLRTAAGCIFTSFKCACEFACCIFLLVSTQLNWWLWCTRLLTYMLSSMRARGATRLGCPRLPYAAHKKTPVAPVCHDQPTPPHASVQVFPTGFVRNKSCNIIRTLRDI